jgi:hypothetical protein
VAQEVRGSEADRRGGEHRGAGRGELDAGERGETLPAGEDRRTA